MFTCHKCAGLLASDETEDTSGLFECRCMSGYVRDWYEAKNRSEAIQHQIEITKQWIQLYKNQGRSQEQISKEETRLAVLLQLDENKG